MKAGEGAAPDSDRVDGAPHPRETLALFGQAAAEAALLEAYRARRLHHAWLLGGPEGAGKATLAWRFARFLLAHPDPSAPAVASAEDLSVAHGHPAVSRVAAGAPGDIAVLRRAWNEKTGKFFSEIRVDDVRRASGLFRQAAGAGGWRICIIDSVEDLNANSANALLKLVEEPPAASLFLVVAHRPGRVLPTLRSRCRLLALDALGPENVASAVAAMGSPWSESDPEAVRRAAARTGGSVKGALRLLGSDRLGVDGDMARLLGSLPAIDWRELHGLGDRIGSDDEFEVLVAAVLDWIHAGIAAPASGGEHRRLAALAEVWEKTRRSARDTLALNLDKKSFLFATFTDLAQAMRTR